MGKMLGRGRSCSGGYIENYSHLEERETARKWEWIK
jgi:hypothetical protein